MQKSVSMQRSSFHGNNTPTLPASGEVAGPGHCSAQLYSGESLESKGCVLESCSKHFAKTCTMSNFFRHLRWRLPGIREMPEPGRPVDHEIQCAMDQVRNIRGRDHGIFGEDGTALLEFM